MNGLSTDRLGKPALGGPLESVVRHLVSFSRDLRGNVAIMFAFAFIPAMLAGGAAVDYSRASSARAEMQTAVDAAALGVARDGATMNDAEIQTHGRRFFDANFQAGSGVTVGSVSVVRQGKTVTVTANASIRTATLSAVSVDKIEFAAVGKTMWGSSKIELALALDNTGSMDSSGKMTALKDAANNLLDILEKNAVEADSFKVSIVPFNTQVKVGTASKDASWLYYPTSGVNSSLVVEKDKWKGCLVDRSKDYDTDASPAVTGNNNTLYPAVKCAESGLTLLRPLTNDWANLHTTVNNMTPDGFTNVTIGLAWALTQLTPDAPLSQAKPWETEVAHQDHHPAHRRREHPEPLHHQFCPDRRAHRARLHPRQGQEDPPLHDPRHRRERRPPAQLRHQDVDVLRRAECEPAEPGIRGHWQRNRFDPSDAIARRRRRSAPGAGARNPHKKSKRGVRMRL